MQPAMTLGAGTADIGDKWTASRKLIVVLAASAFFAEGLSVQAMGLALPSLIKAWDLPRAAFAAPTAWGMVGFATGSFLGGIGGDRFGRRATLICSLFLLAAATAACGLTHNIPELDIIRVLVGFGLGGSLPCATILIAEAAPKRHRSVAIAVGLAFLPVAGSVEGFAAAFFLPQIGWHGLFVACGATIAFLAIMLILFLRDPPRDSAEANRPVPRDKNLGVGATLALLMTRAYRRDTGGLWGAFFFTVLSYYSIFSWLPTALASQGRPAELASGAISAFATGSIGGGILGGWLTQRFGSRLAMSLLASGGALSAALLAFMVTLPAGDPTSLIAVLALLGICLTGMQSVIFTLGAHLYGSQMRSTGIGSAVGWGRIGAIASSFTGVMTINHGGVSAFFLFIGLAALLALGSTIIVRNQTQ